MTSPESAEAITKTSGSNLALSFIALPPERRRDISTFYAFCRVIDDIGDAGDAAAARRAEQLDGWERALAGEVPGEPVLAGGVRALFAKYAIDPSLPRAIIDGVRMDLEPRRFETWADLEKYCWHVASAVGLVSIEIFGYRNPGTRDYAVSLGLALQLTNILRDVKTDLEHGGRIYLPREDMAACGVGEQDLRAGRQTPEFEALMGFEADRAEALYREAGRSLAVEDRRTMVAAEIMRDVYHRLLGRMRRDRFRVFERTYALSRIQKAASVAGIWFGSMFAR